MTNKYDSRNVEVRARRKEIERARNEAERTRFEAKMNGGKLRLKFTESLVSFLSTEKKMCWQITVTFPFEIVKDSRLERFLELIQRDFELVYLQT